MELAIAAILEGFRQAGKQAGMTGFIEGQQTLGHQIIRSSSLMDVERCAELRPTNHHIELNTEDGPFELHGVMAHSLSNDDTFFEVPTLHIRGKSDQKVRILPHSS